MPIRNPFRKNAAGVEPAVAPQDPAAGFRETTTSAAQPIDVKDPAEYKLSEINDSGIYLPPSPPERRSLWNSSRTSTSSNHRSFLSEAEPFNISRESFDSYRRSFDIGARIPICELDSRLPRTSLDARRTPQRQPRSSFQDRRANRSQDAVEEGFEEVGLNDENRPKKRGLFSRFGDNHNENAEPNANAPVTAEGRPNSSHHGFLNFTGRKRGQSGKGEELKSMIMIKADHPAPVVRSGALAVSAE